MGQPSLKILLGLGLLVAQLAIHQAADPAENLTETDAEAEFRQGGIGQQLMSNYPMVGGGLGYGNTGGFQYMTAGSGNTGQGYVNMLRNLYRPPSFGLTDKVKHWVKSFMNRRQYVKPYYNPSVGGLQFSADEFGGKPVVLGGNTYKAFSVPLRQLQKYYKPYYPNGENAVASQFIQSASRPGSGSAPSSILSYNPNSAGATNSGLYPSESASPGNVFSSGSSGVFGTGSDSSSLFPGSSGGNIFTSGGGSSNIFSTADGSSSPLFGAGGSLYGAGGSPSSGLYQGSSGGSSSSLYSLDGSNGGLYGSDGSNAFYGSNNGGSSYGSNAAASSLLSSLSSASGGQIYGDLFASGASPAATIYNPNTGEQVRNYGSGGSHKKQPSFGGSALYMPSDQRNSDSYASKLSPQEPLNSFNVDSSRNSAEPSYSVSFQPAQGKSFSSSYDNSGFQPVAFSSDDSGYKSSGIQVKSS